MNAETQRLLAVIAIAQLAVEMMYVVFAVLMIRLVCKHTQGMKGSVAVPPKLEPLNSTDTLDFAKTVGAALQIGPNNVDVIKSDQILFAKVALELGRSVDACKLVLDWNEAIVNANAVARGVSDAMMFVE